MGSLGAHVDGELTGVAAGVGLMEITGALDLTPHCHCDEL